VCYTKPKSSLAAVAHIPVSLILHDLGVIVAKMRAVHAQRPKQLAQREFAQRLPADALYDLPQQRVSRVAIEMLRARPEIQALLRRDPGHAVVMGNQSERMAPPRQFE